MIARADDTADDDAKGWAALIERRLADGLPVAQSASDTLTLAIREAVLAPGKRLRPLLLVGCTRSLSGSIEAALDAACAIEFIHAASLALDDLPCMDDAPLRRGRPSLHRAFGEDTAALAVVALVSAAFGKLASARDLNAGARNQLVSLLAEAVGQQGLVGGQWLDLHGVDEDQAEQAEAMNAAKTGALFATTLQMGAVIANAPASIQRGLRQCGYQLGHAFQIYDDLKDVGAVPCADGKPLGQDEGKPTLPRLLGAADAMRRLQVHLDAVEAAMLRCFAGDQRLLRLLRRHAGFSMLAASPPAAELVDQRSTATVTACAAR